MSSVAPDRAQAFVIHLIVASLAFALVLALAVGALLLVRWALPLELASSSPQKALEASGRILELHEKFWPVTLVSLIGVALAAAWLGRRITGPLVRFQPPSSGSRAASRRSRSRFAPPTTSRTRWLRSIAWSRR